MSFVKQIQNLDKPKNNETKLKKTFKDKKNVKKKIRTDLKNNNLTNLINVIKLGHFLWTKLVHHNGPFPIIQAHMCIFNKSILLKRE